MAWTTKPPRKSKSTPTTNLRQKADIFHPRGKRHYSRMFVRPLPKLGPFRQRAVLAVGPHSLHCAVGRQGINVKRREGDFITPTGKYRIIEWLARFDRSPGAHMGCRRILKCSGWCDSPRSSAYNRPIRLPHHFSAEALWRDDRVYDLIGVINFNVRPCVRAKGSAIFLHIDRDDFQPTAGCVALSRSQLFKLKPILSAQPQIFIGGRFWRRSPKIAEPTRIKVAPK
jgi:L,D-peptidoglycan transpeptidase YkuD (ErfK/YbiS/YcfS/YnhG family)